MDLGVHLPLIPFDDEPLSLARLQATADAARDAGLGAISANDHLLFSTPWLDGLAALAAVVDRSGELTLATTISLVTVRGPVQLAKSLMALDVLSGGRVIAGVGPGSSERDYEAAGVPFDERWKRFEESVVALRYLIQAGDPPAPDSVYAGARDLELEPGPARTEGIPVWIGSWGSKAGLRRVARLADGWLASAYNTTPEAFAAGRERLAGELPTYGRDPDGYPNALVTMWTWVTEDRAERDHVLGDVLAPLLKREPEQLREQLCVGPAEHCAELLSRYAEAGCERVYLWPIGDEATQLELIAEQVRT